MTMPQTCKLCGSDLTYDGLPAWYCEQCSTVYDDDLNIIAEKIFDDEPGEPWLDPNDYIGPTYPNGEPSGPFAEQEHNDLIE